MTHEPRPRTTSWPVMSARFTWAAILGMLLVIGGDRLAVMLVEIQGAQFADPGGPYHGNDLSQRYGDSVDIILAVTCVALIAWSLWMKHGRTSIAHFVVGGAFVPFAVAVPFGAIFFTPLNFYVSLSISLDREPITMAATGPLWYNQGRRLILILVAVSIVIAISELLLSSRVRAVVGERRERSLLVWSGTVGSATGCVGMMVVLLILHFQTGISSSVEFVIAAVTSLLVGANIYVTKILREPGERAIHTVAMSSGFVGVLWLVLIMWLIAVNPLVTMPSPFEPSHKDELLADFGPAMVGFIGLSVVGILVTLTAHSRMYRPRQSVRQGSNTYMAPDREAPSDLTSPENVIAETDNGGPTKVVTPRSESPVTAVGSPSDDKRDEVRDDVSNVQT